MPRPHGECEVHQSTELLIRSIAPYLKIEFKLIESYQMDFSQDVCMQCFSPSDNVVKVGFGDMELALVRFVNLLETQKLPMMCEARNGSYRVCYARDAVPSETRRELVSCGVPN